MKNLLKYAVLIMSVFAGYVLIMAIAEAQQRIREIRQLNDDRKAIDRRDMVYNGNDLFKENLKNELQAIRLNERDNLKRINRKDFVERIDSLRRVESQERIYLSKDSSLEKRTQRREGNSERRLEKRENDQVIRRNDIRREVIKNERMIPFTRRAIRMNNREYDVLRFNLNLNIENLQATRLKGEKSVKNNGDRQDIARIQDHERKIRESDGTRRLVNTNENDNRFERIQDMANDKIMNSQTRNVNSDIYRSLNYREANERIRDEVSERSKEENRNIREKNSRNSNRLTNEEERINKDSNDILSVEKSEDRRSIERIQRVVNEARSSRKDDYYSFLRKEKYLDDVAFVESNAGNINMEKLLSYFGDNLKSFNFKGLYLTNALGLIGIFCLQKRKYFDEKIVQNIRQYLF